MRNIFLIFVVQINLHSLNFSLVHHSTAFTIFPTNKLPRSGHFWSWSWYLIPGWPAIALDQSLKKNSTETWPTTRSTILWWNRTRTNCECQYMMVMSWRMKKKNSMCSVKLKSQINSYSWMIHNRIIIIKAIVIVVIGIWNKTSGIRSTKVQQEVRLSISFFSSHSSFCLRFGIHPNLNDHCTARTCYRQKK